MHLNLKEKLAKCQNPAEWVAVFAILAFSMFTMFYSDFQGSMNWAYQVTKAIWQGEFGGLQYLCTSNYGMTLFLLLVLWQLPFAPFTMLTDTKYEYYESLGGALWSKLFLVVVTCFMVWAILQIAKELEIKQEYHKWIALFVLTSAFYFVPEVQVGQCDIVGLTFALWGIVFYLRDERWKFLAFFAFAIPMKYYALLLFVPLVLLHEKKIVKVILEGIAGGSLLAVNMLWRKAFTGSFMDGFTQGALGGITDSTAADTASSEVAEIAQGATDATQNVAQTVTVYVESSALQDYLGDIISSSPLLVIAFILLCVLAYFLAPKRRETLGLWTIYLCYLSYSVLILFTETSVYRLILLAPFVTLLVFANKNSNRMRLSVLLETLMSWAMIVVYIFKQSWVIGGINTFDYLFMRNVSVKRDLATYMQRVLELDGLLPYACACVTAGMLGFTLVNIPILTERQNDDGQPFERWLIWFRIGILTAWVLFMIYAMLIWE